MDAWRRAAAKVLAVAIVDPAAKECVALTLLAQVRQRNFDVKRATRLFAVAIVVIDRVAHPESTCDGHV